MSDTTSDPARRDRDEGRQVPSPDQDVASGQPYDPRQDPDSDSETDTGSKTETGTGTDTERGSGQSTTTGE